MKNNETFKMWIIREEHEIINHYEWIDVYTGSRNEVDAEEVLNNLRKKYPHRRFTLIEQTEKVLNAGAPK